MSANFSKLSRIKGEAEGDVTDVESGDIGFETEAAYHRRLAKEKAKPKVKLAADLPLEVRFQAAD